MLFASQSVSGSTTFHRFRFRALLPVLLGIALIMASPLAAQYADVIPVDKKLQTGFDSITEQESKELLEVLASPSFEGRGTGQPGYTRAAHWIAGKLAELGLEPVGDQGTYFQSVPMIRRWPDLERCRLTGPENLDIPGEGNLGFDRMSNIPELEAQVVFIQAMGSEFQLPDELVLRDRMVMYVADEAAARRLPRMLARKRPAAAMRVIEEEPVSTSIITFPGRRSRSTSISGTIKQSAARSVLSSIGGDPELVASQSNDGIEIVEFDKSVTITVPLREEKTGAPNVVAWLPGSDPKLNHEYVVVGAHLDHLGQRGGFVFPGADDNGSGSIAILQIARAMVRNPDKPRRSVLFIWFTGEEMGLQGSRYYVNNPLLPLENMTCMLNIDMVGRNEATNSETEAENEGHLHLVGSQKGESALHDLVLKANQHTGFEFEFDEEDVFGRSDQINFYQKGVPVAFLFGGFHPDYHQPSDQVSEINFKKIARAARLFYCTLHLASEHGRFELKESEE